MHYPEDFINKVIQGDCLEVMKDIPDKSIDLVLVDPPYGIGIAKNTNISIKGVSDKQNNFTKKDWDSFIPAKKYFDEIMRISKNQIIWGGNYFAHLLPPTSCYLVWWKKDGLPRGTFADCELAWTSFKKPAQVFNSRWHGFIRDSKEDRVAHPTQKALDVMKWCVEEFSKEGELICDPFAGSGTTGVACKNLNRNYILIEKEPEYCGIIKKRLQEAKAGQMAMFKD
jgi:site-specific DNA-methyltransferase (adenine-specific)